MTVIGKDTEPSDLPELVLNALRSWDPAPHRLLMSKMRAELDNKGVPVESEILNDLFLQAAWLEEFLETDESTRQLHIRNAVHRHWEAIGDKLESEVSSYADHLFGYIQKQDRSEFRDRFAKLDIEACREDILLHVNCHNCSKPIEGVHLSTGHIIRLRDGGDEYKLCLSPACDLEPGQKVGSGFHKRLGDWMPFTAVSLLKVPGAALSTALSEASTGSYVFIRGEGESEVQAFECVPNLSEPMFVANQGRFSEEAAKDMSFSRIRGNGSEISSEPVSGTIVGQLRYEYALNLLHRLGHHLARVGLNFKALRTTDSDLG